MDFYSVIQYNKNEYLPYDMIYISEVHYSIPNSHITSHYLEFLTVCMDERLGYLLYLYLLKHNSCYPDDRYYQWKQCPYNTHISYPELDARWLTRLEMPDKLLLLGRLLP